MHEEEFYSFTLNGYAFKAFWEYDDTGRAPWEDDCTLEGVVSKWEHRNKRPSERILCTDGRSRRFFDVRRYVQIARRDGCTGQQAAEQAERAFQHLRAWCDDEWHYVGVIVRAYTAEGRKIKTPPAVMDSLWRIEDADQDYMQEVAREIAGEIAYALNQERQEAAFWAARGLVTA